MESPTKLIVGLGNPGKEYERTRHNVGFMVIDAFARAHGIALGRKAFRGLLGDGKVGAQRVYLLKPMTYMNLSGQAVADFCRQKPIALTDILVVVDDIALPIAQLRLRTGGSAGGHNGLKSLIAHLQSQDFPRLRFGVGAPRDAAEQIDFVLGPFAKSEMTFVDEGVVRSVEAIETWLDDGIEKAMN